MLRRTVTAVCLLVMLLPAIGLVAAADPRSDLEEIDEQLERAREGLEVIEAQRDVTLQDLQAADAVRAQLDAELAALNVELAEAEAALAEVEAELAATTAELTATEAHLADTRRELRGARDQFRDRARASYISSGLGYAEVLFGARDVVELTRASGFLHAVLASDRAQVERIAALELEVEAELTVLADLQERQGAQQRLAQAERDRRAGIVAARQSVQQQVAAEAAHHRELLAQLDNDKASYEALVAELEQQSAQLEAELATLASAGTAPSGRLAWPANGVLTSGYGYRVHPIHGTRRFHAGIDIGAGYGSPIYAAEAGTVVSAGPRGGYGNTVVIDHGGGLATLYAHQSQIAVFAGEAVSRGQVIGYIGSTGFSTGPHLHFEVRVNGSPRDPMGYL